jgi:hypothetical protein
MLLLWIKRFLVLTAVFAGGCMSRIERHDEVFKAERRAVDFLKREVPAWSKENGCFSCHNNGDGARALYAASRRGHRIPVRVLADTTAWLAQPDVWEQNKEDPGFSDKRLANLQFTAALLSAFEAGYVTDRKAIQEAAEKVMGDQTANGAWPIEPQNALGSPVTYGTTLATYLASKTLKPVDAPKTRDAIRKAEDWLRQARPENVLAAATFLLASADKTFLVGGDSHRGAERGTGARIMVTSKSEECLDLIRLAQTREGGWGPYADSPPEPFDTAVVLLALAEFRDAPRIDELIRRGRIFLAAEQLPDGGWPATTRPPRGESYAQRVSTTGWALLALLATRD